MNKVAILSGRYKALSQIVVSRFTGQQQIDYTVYQPGEEFVIDAGTGYVARQYLTYHPDFGDESPRFEAVSE